MANLFQNIASFVAPKLAIRHAKTMNDLQMLGMSRSRNESTLQTIRRGYEGAKIGRLSGGWMTPPTDANAEIAIAHVRLRDRARDLVRNNPYASKAVRTHASSIIGTGIIPTPKTPTKEQDAAISDLWNDFSDRCDIEGRTNFYGIQNLMVRSMVESGECLLQFVNRPSNFGLKIPLQLRVLEADHFDRTRDREIIGGGYILQGIEYDPNGLRVAYWLFPRHPGSYRHGVMMKSVRVPAEDIVHLYDRTRPEQNRGVTWFSSVMMRMHDMDDYDLSELIRKKMESTFTAFITGAPKQDTFGDEKDPNGRTIEAVEPGQITYLEPGEDVKFGAPASVSGYAEYADLHLHAIAAGLGLTYELLTGDLSKVNYSSIRAGLIEYRRWVEYMQNLVIIPCLCRPVWDRFLATTQASGMFGNDRIRLQWTPPQFESVDPVKDITAEILAVRNGLMSPQTAIARQGYDPDVVMTQFSEMYKLWDLLKIVVDLDARQTTKNGLPKTMEAGNAIDKAA